MDETGWKDISTLGDEPVVRLRCNDGKERTGWRYDDSKIEIAGTGAFVMDASRYTGDMAVKAAPWKSAPPPISPPPTPSIDGDRG